MKNKTLNTTVSLEHINPELIDIPVEIEYATDSGYFEPLKVTVEEEVEYNETGRAFKLLKGEAIPLTETLKEELERKFEDEINDDEKHEYYPQD